MAVTFPLPPLACQLTPAQAAAVLAAAAAGTLDTLGFPADQVLELELILSPVLQLDADGHVAVPLDVLTAPGTLVDAVQACLAEPA